MIQLKKEHFLFAAGALQWVIAHGQKKMIAPEIETADDRMLGSMDRFYQFFVNLPVSCIKTIVPCHFKVLFRDVLYEQLDEVNGREGFLDKGIVFMPVVMKSHGIAVIGINPGEGNDRTTEVAADISDNGMGVAEVWFCINIKPVFVFLVYESLGFFEGGADSFFQSVKENGLKSFTEVGVIEICDITPEAVIGKPAFGEKAVDVGIPFKRASEGMEDADKTRNKVFGSVQGEKKVFDDIGNSIKEAVKQVAVLEKERPEGFVNRKDEMPVSAVDQLKRHSVRPVNGIFGTTGRAELGVAAERNEFQNSAMRTAIHGTPIRRVTTVDNLINVFHDNRSWFEVVFNNFIIVF